MMNNDGPSTPVAGGSLRTGKLFAIVLLLLASVSSLPAQTLTPDQRLGREILREMIETKTPTSVGTTALAEKIAARYRAAGFPTADVHLVGATDRNKNVVVRYRGTGARKPVLLLGHLDVVEARREDWSFDPFTLIERDGYFYGRGTQDIKGGDTTLVAALLRLRQEGFRPDRDLILALTADEESGGDNGVQWLLANRRDLIEAEFCINVDAGGGEIVKGTKTTLDVQAAEKIYQTFTLTVRNPGGHSSLPTRDNAIYRLAAALQRLSTFDFPVRLNGITRAYFERMAGVSTGSTAEDMRAVTRTPALSGARTSGVEGPPDSAAVSRLSASPLYNALLRTTCVATMLDAGHAENALPQTARAQVNCRLLPDEPSTEVQQTLIRVIADSAVTVEPQAPPAPSPPSIPTPEFLEILERISRSLWGNVAVVPYMETGATDGLHLRNAGMPVFGTSGIFADVDDVRAHGKDERILVSSFYEGLEFAYQLLKATGGR